MTLGSLSVLMPNYNQAEYIEEALEAVMNQSLPAMEVLLLDDGSTDNSREIIAKFARKSSLIRVWHNEENKGIHYSWNRLMDQAIGDYIVGCSADDRVLPGFFEKSMALLARYPQAGLCCAYHSTLDSQTGAISVNPSNWCSAPRFFTPQELAEVINDGAIPGHSSIVKRSALHQAGAYIRELKWHCDWFALLVVAARHGICHIPEPLALLRVTPASYSSAGMRNEDQQREVIGHLLRLLRSPAYADIIPFFQKTKSWPNLLPILGR